MATSNLVADVINGVVIIKSVPDAGIVVVGADGNNTAGTVIGALSVAENLAANAYKSTIPGASLLAASIYNNIDEANLDLANSNLNNRIDDSTMVALTTDLLSVMSLAAAIALAPELAALAAIAATALSLAALATDNSTDISDTYLDLLDKTKSMVNDFDLSGAIDDLIIGTPTTTPLPGLDAFNYIDPNNPNNYNPNDGNNLNTDTDGDGIPDSLDPYPNDASPDADGDGIPDNIDQYPNDPNNGEGHQTPYNPTTPGMSDPLVLDSDKDGFISTISLDDSSAYFDLTGDGVKEKVGWISPNDGILAYDKDDNGNISGIDEVFGSGKVSGFTELRELADSNYDGVIDRKDELYSRLKVWHDVNGDGISQADELVSLKDEGVTSINLNAVTTNIEVNGNLITEASKYTDNQGSLELAADVELQYVEKVNTNPTAVNDFEVDPTTYNLSNLRGYGYVENAFNVYNKDDNFKALAKEYANDITKVATNFEEFVAEWSGFYKMAESKGISKESFSENVLDVPSIKVWILERFAGANVDKWRTEAHLRENTGGGYHTTVYRNEQYIHDSFNKLIEQYESKFAIDTFYADVYSDTHYDMSLDEFVIDDENAFNSKVTNYLNNTEIDVKNKLYLAQVMNMQEGEFLHFDAQAIVDSVEDAALQTTISDIYSDKVRFEYMSEDGHYRYDNSLIYGNETDDTVNLNTKQTTTVFADKGDDKIIDNAGGDTTYIYKKGDGSDVIFDGNGNDTLKFEDIALVDVDIQTDSSDLIITLKEDPSDKVIIKDWIDSDNRIENITFADGATPNFSEIINTHFISADNDNIDLTNNNDTVNMLDGDDTVSTLGGDDTIDGGAGNDTINEDERKVA